VLRFQYNSLFDPMSLDLALGDAALVVKPIPHRLAAPCFNEEGILFEG